MLHLFPTAATLTNFAILKTCILCKDSREGSSQSQVCSNFIVLFFGAFLAKFHEFGSRGIWDSVYPIYVVKSLILWKKTILLDKYINRYILILYGTKMNYTENFYFTTVENVLYWPRITSKNGLEWPPLNHERSEWFKGGHKRPFLEVIRGQYFTFSEVVK